MKKFLLGFFLVTIISCNEETGAPDNAPPTANELKIDRDRKDSLERGNMNYQRRKMIQMHTDLTKRGYTNLRAWMYIDSVSKVVFQGSLPVWYQKVKREADSTLKAPKL